MSNLKNILVCMKQVPDISKVRLDPDTNTLIRSGVKNILNPYDGYALEAALRLKDENPENRIITLSMGPKQAEDILRSSLALGADRAYLIEDAAFAGSDTYATALILSEAVKEISRREQGFEAIFCGRQAVDGDTAQIGPALAERLGLTQLTAVLKLRTTEKGFEALQEGKRLRRIYKIKTPCLLSFTKPDFELRQASLKGRLRAKKEPVERLNLSILNEINRDEIGISGSPTAVIKSYAPVREKKGEIISAEPGEAAEVLISRLREKMKGSVR